MDKCFWDYDPDDGPGVYDTTCQNRFEFTDAGVKENNFKFCPFCGGEIVEEPAGNTR